MTTYKNPFFTGIPARVGNTNSVSIENSIGLAGLNTGNFLFVSAIRRLLNCADKFDDCNINYKNSVITNEDCIVISAANWINKDIDLGDLADFLETNDLPCVVIGLGAQADIGHKVSNLPAGTKRFLSIVSKRCNYISVRGKFTQSVLEEYGVYNTWVTGCPSLIGSGHSIAPLNKSKRIDNISQVVVQGTRHGTSNSIFSESHSAKLNLDIYRLAIRNHMPLLLQSEVPDIYLSMNGTIPKDKESNYHSFLESVYLKDIYNIKSYLSSKGLIYWDTDTWFKELAQFDGLIGTRIHGVVSALSSGIPAVLLTHDERTTELAHTLNIPFYDINKIPEITNNVILKILNDADFELFNTRYEMYRLNFKAFFESNNISNIL